MTSSPHDSVWETDLTPAVKFGVARENQGLYGNASASIRRFSGGSGEDSSSILDREDYYLNTNAYHRTERDALSAHLDYSRDSTLDSELDETGNVISNRATRERYTLGPSWTRSLNEKTSLNLDYTFTTVSFSNDPGVDDLVNYDYQTLSSSLTRQITPRLQGTLSASYSTYEPDTNINSETTSIQAGLSRNLSETLVASFLIGQRNTTSDTLVATGYCIFAIPGASFPACTGGIPVPTGTKKDELDTTGSIYSASIAKTLETGNLSARLSRVTSPGSQGELLDTTQLILSGEKRFSETLTSTLRFQYAKNETIVNALGREADQTDETFFRISPRISWRWQREWELAGEYEYAENEDKFSNTATRNAFYLTLSYTPVKFYVSR
ncbi:MAG TPA: hypothetical protein VET88_15825 [Gammaproteobacteria bacterium]|nr:hypothetical protein [Gammaproteobacteria bacterium]